MGDFNLSITFPLYRPITFFPGTKGGSKEEGAPTPTPTEPTTHPFVLSTEVSGRGRYQYERNEADDERHRGRYQILAGLGLFYRGFRLDIGFASGNGPTARSYNVTFDDVFSTSYFLINELAISWSYQDYISLIFGKMVNPFYSPGDLIEDRDLMPEGGAIRIRIPVNDETLLFNTGIFILDEIKQEATVFNYAIQIGIQFNSDNHSYNHTVLASFRGFSNVFGWNPGDYSTGTNSRDETGRLATRFSLIDVSAEFNFRIHENVSLGLIGEFVVNPGTETNSIGFMTGLSLEAYWFRSTLSYRLLQTDSVPDFLPDSDAMSGGTNGGCFEADLRFRILSSPITVELGADYYWCRRLEPQPVIPITEHLLQLNVSLAWTDEFSLHASR
ncbi:MAG: putative porin [Candidatus Margulisiibacteriota bacterium]